VSRERHDLPPVRSVDAVILPAEGDAFVFDRDQTAIGDGDAVGIAGEIAQHLLGSGERVLAVDYPFAFAQRRQESLERSCVGECRVVAEKLQTTLRVGLDQHGQEPPRNRRDSTLTCMRKPGRLETHRAPSSESPPPGTIMCTCG